MLHAGALTPDIISERESEMLKRLQQLRRRCIRVDDFAPDFSQEQSQPQAVAKTRAA